MIEHAHTEPPGASSFVADLDTAGSVVDDLSPADSILASKMLDGFTGSQACSECHRERFESYSQTHHSRSLRRPEVDDELLDVTFAHEPSGRVYSVRAGQHSEIVHAEKAGENATRYLIAELPVTLVVGSGAFAKSYLAKAEDGWIQLPLSYFSATESYRMSPGYDTPRHHGFTRQIDDRCLFCHAGSVSRTNDNPNDFSIHELSIGCERCHGPGETHSSRYRAIQRGDDDAKDISLDQIVNPATMNSEQALSLCAQCHLQGDVTIYPPGADPWSFQAGDELGKTRAVYSVSRQGDKHEFVGHHAQMQQSVCFQQSDIMTCVTCHDPHHSIPTDDLRSLRRQQCLSCHQDEECGLEIELRLSKNKNHCVQCHMPRGDSNVPHIATTNHRIAVYRSNKSSRRAGNSENESHQDTEASLPVPTALLDSSPVGSAEQKYNETAAIAHWILSLASSKEQSIDNFTQIADELQSAIDDLATKPVAGHLLLSQLYHRVILVGHDSLSQSQELAYWKQAISHATNAETSNDLRATDRAIATQIIAQAGYRYGDFDNAVMRYERLTQIRRAAPDWYNLGLCYGKQRRFAEAERALRNSIRIDGAQPDAHRALFKWYRTIGSDLAFDFATKANFFEFLRSSTFAEKETRRTGRIFLPFTHKENP